MHQQNSSLRFYGFLKSSDHKYKTFLQDQHSAHIITSCSFAAVPHQTNHRFSTNANDLTILLTKVVQEHLNLSSFFSFTIFELLILTQTAETPFMSSNLKSTIFKTNQKSVVIIFHVFLSMQISWNFGFFLSLKVHISHKETNDWCGGGLLWPKSTANETLFSRPNGLKPEVTKTQRNSNL